MGQPDLNWQRMFKIAVIIFKIQRGRILCLKHMEADLMLVMCPGMTNSHMFSHRRATRPPVQGRQPTRVSKTPVARF
jgi:hypothetical protein